MKRSLDKLKDDEWYMKELICGRAQSSAGQGDYFPASPVLGKVMW